MPPSKAQSNFHTLRTTISSTTTLIRTFQSTLQSPSTPPTSIANPPNPLALLSDASKVLKAQTTKLSLLLLNKPFTPSAITFILNSLAHECLPALMSGLELCPAEEYTNLLHEHVKKSLARIMVELSSVLTSIPLDEHGIEKGVGRDTLASTGVLWEECDGLVTLASEGLVRLAVRKVEEYHGLLKDAIEELEGWDADEDEEGMEDSASDDGENIPPTPATDRSALETSLKNLSLSTLSVLKTRALDHLRLIRLLYPILVKQRISTFPNVTSTTTPSTLPTPTQVQSLDRLISYTQQFTEETDEIAGALYASDEDEVERRLGLLREMGTDCVRGVKMGWEGKEDAFGGFVEKWSDKVEKVGRGDQEER